MTKQDQIENPSSPKLIFGSKNDKKKITLFTDLIKLTPNSQNHLNFHILSNSTLQRFELQQLYCKWGIWVYGC